MPSSSPRRVVSWLIAARAALAAVGAYFFVSAVVLTALGPFRYSLPRYRTICYPPELTLFAVVAAAGVAVAAVGSTALRVWSTWRHADVSSFSKRRELALVDRSEHQTAPFDGKRALLVMSSSAQRHLSGRCRWTCHGRR